MLQVVQKGQYYIAIVYTVYQYRHVESYYRNVQQSISLFWFTAACTMGCSGLEATSNCSLLEPTFKKVFGPTMTAPCTFLPRDNFLWDASDDHDSLVCIILILKHSRSTGRHLHVESPLPTKGHKCPLAHSRLGRRVLGTRIRSFFISPAFSEAWFWVAMCYQAIVHTCRNTEIDWITISNLGGKCH